MQTPLGFDFGDPGGAEALMAQAGFDLSGFDLEHLPGRDGIETQVYRKPLLYRPQGCAYDHAEDFAKEIVLDGEHETFAFVSGNFVFGDFVEALVAMGKLSVKRMSLMTLSLNDENIDSIRNIIEWEPVERFDLVLSDYWYAHERKRGGAGRLPVRGIGHRRHRPARRFRWCALQDVVHRDASGEPPDDPRQRELAKQRQHRAGVHHARRGDVRIRGRLHAEGHAGI
jgi:hypothetical protein